MHALEWARLPGDLIFIVVGVVPLVIAALKTFFGLYRTPDITRAQNIAGEAA
jgi:nitric oxide reductase subunit B